MIWAILLLATGICIALAAFFLRKKLRRAWIASLLAGGLLLTACGGWFTYGQSLQARERKESVYLCLRYLEQYQTEPASYYLKKSGTDGDYVSASSRYLLERMRENELTARLNLDIATSLAKSGEQEQFLTALRAVDIQNSEQLSMATGRLSDMLGISQKRKTILDLYMQAENGWYSMSEEEFRAMGLSEIAQDRLRISAMLSGGAYDSAVASAVELVDRHPSADNRLLLAEAVAESAYHGAILSDSAFAAAGENEGKMDSSASKEREKADAELAKIRAELAELELSAAADEEMAQSLSQRKLELTEKAKELQSRVDKLYVYRAFNAIADIHSLEAKLTRARLYFALQDYDQAKETLLDTARSLQARLTPNQNMANSLRVVKQAYSGEDGFYENQEFRDTMSQLLSEPFSDLMYVSRGQLTLDFTQRIISDQKTYGHSLAVSGIDLSGYPTVRVTLSGREEVLRQVVEHQSVTSRDTHEEIVYTAQLVEGTASDVCVVVDRSGSMGGGPIEDLKTALSDFIRNLQKDVSMSLVAFESSAQCLEELTHDQTVLLTTVDSLAAGGGTDITSGIISGMETLAQAGGNRIMLLMTDGQSNVNFDVVDEAAAQGITIHTIGFGGVNDGLLQEIADRTGGQYVKADSSTELSNVYAGLQQIIGNLVTIEYTVTNTEEQELRYFFLETGGYSVRRDYTLTSSGSAPQIYSCAPVLLSPSDIQRYADYGRDLDLVLRGAELLRVESVTVGGQTAEITDRQSDWLRLSVQPSLAEGWQSVTLRQTDGTEYTFDRLLLVGEAVSYRNIRLGSLVIPYAWGVLPGDGTLVLAGNGIDIRENVAEGNASSLQLTVSGTLILPWYPAQSAGEEVAFGSGTDLGGQGVIDGWGLVQLEYGDSAYSSNAPISVVKGGFCLECAPEQSKLIQKTEGGTQ